MQNKIDRLKRKFRILKQWQIKYYKATKNNQACTAISPNKRIAHIYGYGRKDIPEDYLFHEFLHITFNALLRMDRRKPKEIKQAEENLIQDICTIIFKRNE